MILTKSKAYKQKHKIVIEFGYKQYETECTYLEKGLDLVLKEIIKDHYNLMTIDKLCGKLSISRAKLYRLLSKLNVTPKNSRWGKGRN